VLQAPPKGAQSAPLPYCAEGTVTMIIRMKPRPGSQKGAQSAPFASCAEGTTGVGLVLYGFRMCCGKFNVYITKYNVSGTGAAERRYRLSTVGVS